MRQVTKVYNLYKFEELSDTAREKVLSYFRDSEDFPFLGEYLEQELERLLATNGIKYDELPRLYYSLSWSQGDGAMFEGTVYWKSYTATIKQFGRYYHYNSKNIDLASTKTDKQASEKTYQEFNDIYVDICQALEKCGYAEIDYQLSEQVIKENIEANMYEFTEYGDMA